MKDFKKNMTKVVPLKSKNKISKKEKLSDSDSSQKSASLHHLEELDPKLKALQKAIDQGLYNISTDLILENFLDKSDVKSVSINKTTLNSAKNVGSKLQILKKNKA